MRTAILIPIVVLGVAITWSMAENDQSTSVQAQRSRVPLKIPANAKAAENPIEATKASLERGQRLYGSQCVMCHGHKGDGSGDLVERLELKMPDFTDPQVLERRTDGELFYILTHGHGSMPGQHERLPEEWRWDLVNALRALVPK